MPFPKVEADKRTIPSLKGLADFRVEQEVRRLWSASFQLQDAAIDVLDTTLTKDTLLDRPLAKGKPLLVILRQDTVGGWSVSWATNPDGSLKFKGMSGWTLDTTANTYSILIFYATSETEALVAAGVTGGNLS